MNDKKVEGFRLIVEPSGKKRYGGNRSRSRSRDNKKKHRRRRRYFLCYLVLHLQAHHLPHQGAQDPLPQILAHHHQLTIKTVKIMRRRKNLSPKRSRRSD